MLGSCVMVSVIAFGWFVVMHNAHTLLICASFLCYSTEPFSVLRYLAYRLDNFVVGLSNTDPSTSAPVFKSSYTVCGQFSGSVPVSGNATIICAPSAAGTAHRYVIVQPEVDVISDALCLVEVRVYDTSKSSCS